MSAPVGPIWVVATDGALAGLLSAWSDASVPPVPLAWGALTAHADVQAAEAALARDGRPLVMLTSAYAAQALAAGAGEGVRAACVGPATAGAARERGFEVVVEGMGGGAELAEQVKRLDPRPERVLWLRAASARPEARAALAAVGIEIEEITVYDVKPRSAFAAEVAAAPDPGVVVFGSPRAAEALHAAGVVLPDPVGRWVPGEVTAKRVRALFGGDVRVQWPGRDGGGDHADG